VDVRTRVDSRVGARKSPIGLLPEEGDLDLKGMDISSEDMKELMKVDSMEFRAGIPDIEQYFAKFGNRVPERLKKQLKEFIERLG